MVGNWRSGKIRFLEVVGFNILRFDIPLLLQKGIKYSIGSFEELNKLWYDTFTRDYFQVTLLLNNMRFKGLTLEYLAEKIGESGVKVPESYGMGEQVKDWYENTEYGEIIKHLDKDLKIIRIIDLNYSRLFKRSP